MNSQTKSNELLLDLDNRI